VSPPWTEPSPSVEEDLSVHGLALLLCLNAVGLAAPDPAPKGPPLYYPATVGAQWVYRTGDGTEETRTVTKVEMKGRALVVHEARVSGDEDVPIGVTTVSPAGLSRPASSGRDLDPPLTLLKLPAKAGEAWAWTSPFDGATHKYRTRGEEEVAVPAGKYKAVAVEDEFERGGKPVRGVYWYAPAVGLVKAVTKSEDGERVALELTSFRRVAD
jgi:hypothetical protein